MDFGADSSFATAVEKVREHYGVEVSQLLKQAVQIANTKFRGEYIFSGTKIDAPAATATTDVDGNIQSVTFGGSNSEPSSEVKASRSR